jgi:hypothetical protein
MYAFDLKNVRRFWRLQQPKRFAVEVSQKVTFVVADLKLPARVRIAVNDCQTVNGPQPLDYQVLSAMAVCKIL